MQLSLRKFPVKQQTAAQVPSQYDDKCSNVYNIIVFWSSYFNQCKKYEWKKIKRMGKTTEGKQEVIGGIHKNKSKSETAQVYGIPLSALSTYLKNDNSSEQQALWSGNILKQMRIHRTNHGDMENELIHWFCHAQRNTTAPGGQMVNVTADELANTNLQLYSLTELIMF